MLLVGVCAMRPNNQPRLLSAASNSARSYGPYPTSSACSTAGRSSPVFSIALASLSLAMMCSGLCFLRHLDFIESLLPHGGIDIHTDWIRISQAGHGGLDGTAT